MYVCYVLFNKYSKYSSGLSCGLQADLIQLLFAVARSDPKLFCYYSSYAQNRPDAGKFLPEDINAKLCSHVIFAFADIIQGSNLKASGWNDLDNGKDAGTLDFC